MKTKNLITFNDVLLGYFIFDKVLTTKYTKFWRKAKEMGLKAYHITDGLGQGRRFIAIKDLEVARQIALSI